MSTKFNTYLRFVFAFVFSAVIVSIVAYKANIISFTHDESFSFLRYVHEDFMDILSLKHGYTNNHILNTIFMKWSGFFFGNSEFALRLPNIVALVIYLFYAGLLFFKKTPVLSILFMILITCNTYLLEFFGLARGYGLSIAFMLMSFYHLGIYFDTKKTKHLILFNFAALLATLANLTLLNFYIASLISFNLLTYLQFKTCGQKHEFKTVFKDANKINFFAIILSILVLFEPIRRVNLLNFGGKNGFIEDTVATLIYTLFYETPHKYTGEIALKIIAVGLTLLIFMLIIWRFIKHDQDFFHRFSFIVLANFILLLITASSIAQHLFLKSDFYIGRFALFLHPLFILNFVFFIYYLFVSGYKIISSLLTLIPAVCLMFLLIQNFNFKYTLDWKYDMGTKMAVEKVKEAHEKDHAKKVYLGINWIFEPATNFYKRTLKLDWLEETNREGIHKEFDYYYIFNTDTVFDQLKDKPILFKCTEANSLLFSSH